MYHYVYRLDHIETKEFYIGSRTSSVHPSLDCYLGSMVVWKPDKTKLIKTILKDNFNNRNDAIGYEASLITENINDSLNRNYSIPNTKFFTNKELFNNKNHQSGEKNSRFGTVWITNGVISKSVKKEGIILDEGWVFGRVINKIKDINDIKPKKISNVHDHKGCNNSQYNTVWITNNEKSVKIKKGELIPNGWRLGYVNKNLIGYKWINDGIKNGKLLRGKELPDGWRYGMI